MAKTTDQIAEEGIGLLAQAMFRASQTDPSEAVSIGEAAISTLSAMTMDFRRQEAKQKKEVTNA